MQQQFYNTNYSLFDRLKEEKQGVTALKLFIKKRVKKDLNTPQKIVVFMFLENLKNTSII